VKRENIVVAAVGRGIAIPSRVPDVHLLKNIAMSLQQSELSIVLNAQTFHVEI